MTEIMQVESPGPMENQPWTFFYRMGEEILERRRARESRGGTTPRVSVPDGISPDEEAALRMVDDGCPNR